MKAYYGYFEGEEWGILIHGDTRGKAKYRFCRRNPEGSSSDSFRFVRLERVPGLDDKALTWENADAVNWHYFSDEYDDDGRMFLPEEEWINYCDCPVCRPKVVSDIVN